MPFLEGARWLEGLKNLEPGPLKLVNFRVLLVCCTLSLFRGDEVRRPANRDGIGIY